MSQTTSSGSLVIVSIPLALWRMNWTIVVAPFTALFNVLSPISDQLGLLHSSRTPSAMLVVEALAAVDAVLLLLLAYSGRKPSQRTQPKAAPV